MGIIDPARSRGISGGAQVQKQSAELGEALARARQTDSVERQEESQTDAAGNVFASARATSIRQRVVEQARTLDKRGAAEAGEPPRVEGVGEKTGEDLAKQYHQRNDELDERVLRRLAEELKNATDFEDVLNRVLREVPDPTLANEVLEYLELAVEGNAKKVISDAKHYLNLRFPREIASGRNISEAIKEVREEKKLNIKPNDLRNLYREITQEPKDHNILFMKLREKYPSFKDLKAVSAFLLKGMSYDLQAKGPSIQPQELMRLMTEVRKVQSILWTYGFFKSREVMIGKLYEEYGCENRPPHFETLAKRFVDLVEERYPTADKILDKLRQQGINDPDEQIIILNQYRDACRALSPRMFRDLKHKEDLLKTIVQASTKLEEAQEE